MDGFFHLTPGEEALKTLLTELDKHSFSTGTETVPVTGAQNRIIGSRIVSPEKLPTYPKSTMDGYAVRAADVQGASENIPVRLTLAGEVEMGKAPALTVGTKEACLIHTGGMVPGGADAVVMIEQTEKSSDGRVSIFSAPAPGDNVIQPGAELHEGEILFEPGHRVRPQDIGGLLALGIGEITVFTPPRVAICSTGDELVPADREPGPAQIRDINSHTLSAIAAEAGGDPERIGILPDNFDTVLNTAREALETSDILVISAGSSVSVRDLTTRVINELGSPGVLLHGVAVKPGKPVILAVCNGKPVIGLPGNPVSTFVTATLFLVPLIHRSLSVRDIKRPPLKAVMSRNYRSVGGRKEYLPVNLTIHDGTTFAEPMFGKSNLIFTLVRSQGLVEIPLEAGGLHQGEEVEVHLFKE